MTGLALQAAGVLAMLAAVGHGVLGDKTIAAQPIEPERLKTFIRFCYQFGSLGWLGGGALLCLAPIVLPPESWKWVVLSVVPFYAFGAGVNVWFTKARHFGGWMLGLVVLLAVAGLL